MNFRPYFEAALGDAQLDRCWPPRSPVPVQSMGRYDAVWQWMCAHPERVRSHFGPPVPVAMDMQNRVSMAAFLFASARARNTEPEITPVDRWVPWREDARTESSDYLPWDDDWLAARVKKAPSRDELLGFVDSPDRLSIVQLVSADDFDAEGVRMQHCLRSFLHYFDEHERKEIAILSVRQRGRPVATIEVDLRSRANAARVTQLQGPSNGEIPEGVAREDLRALLRGLGLWPHVHGRWRARVDSGPLVSESLRAAQMCDARLFPLLDHVRHVGEAVDLSPAALLLTGASYLHRLPFSQTVGVRASFSIAPLRLRLEITDGTNTWTGASWIEVEAARTGPAPATDTPEPDATLTGSGRAFRVLFSALPA